MKKKYKIIYTTPVISNRYIGYGLLFYAMIMVGIIVKVEIWDKYDFELEVTKKTGNSGDD